MDSTITVALTVLGLCAFAAKAAVDEKVLMEKIETCKRNNNLDDDDLEDVMKANYTAEKSKCFVTCVGQQIGYIQDHEFSERGALTVIDTIMKDASDAHKLKAKEVVTKCAKKLKDNPPKGCEIGPATAQCLAKGAIDNGIISKENIAKMKPPTNE